MVGRCGRGGTVDARGLGPRPYGGGGSTPLARTGLLVDAEPDVPTLVANLVQ